MSDTVAPAGAHRRDAALVICTVLVASASAIRMLAYFTSATAGYYVTELGHIVLLATACAACLAGIAVVWRAPDTSWSFWFLGSTPLLAVFGWPPWWSSEAALVMLTLALVTAAKRASRDVVMFAILAAFVVSLVGFGLSGLIEATRPLTALFPGDTIRYRYPEMLSPNGILVLRTEYFDPGAVGSSDMFIDVEPRCLALAGKRVYSGPGHWRDDDGPDVAWSGNTTVLVGGRQLSLLEPEWCDYGD